MNTRKIFVVALSTAVVAFATTPYVNAADDIAADQHSALAQEFRAKAAAASEKAAAHKVMARSGGSPKANRQAMASHCEHLIARYQAEAAGYEAQAAQHEQLGATQ